MQVASQDVVGIIFNFLDFVTMCKKVPLVCSSWNQVCVSLMRRIELEHYSTRQVFKEMARICARVAHEALCVKHLVLHNRMPKFSAGFFTSSMLVDLLQARGAQLQVLEILNCEMLTKASFEAIADYCNQLQVLILKNVCHLDDACLERICQSNPHLHNLTVLACIKFDNYLQYCPSLVNLHVRYMPEQAVQLATVQHVHVTSNEEENPIYILKMFPNLQSFKVDTHSLFLRLLKTRGEDDE